MLRRSRILEIALTLPSLAWLLAFLATPTLIVVVLAFRQADATGGLAPGWTIAQILALADPQYRPLVWRTLWISGATALICLATALPAGFAMARAPARWRNTLLLLVIIPFWTNFLIRVFAWKALLQAGGPVSRLLGASGLFEDPPTLLYNSGAVLLIMVYTLLPFAILPIYAAAERFDFSLLDAARDLGASRLRAFWTVFVPGIRTGILAGAIMVLVTALGMYVVPDIVGGTDSEMIGNKIAQRAQADRNLPLAAALAAALLAAVMALLSLARAFAFRRRGALEQREQPAGIS